MKRIPSLVVPALVLSATAALLLAQEVQLVKSQEVRMRPSHETLSRLQAKVKREESRSGSKVIPVEKGTLKQQVPASERKGIVKRSTILCSGYNWTLVPKGAVLHVPAVYSARVDGERKGKLVPWQVFFARNQGWIQTRTVSIQQARGEVEVKKEQLDADKRAGRVVVSVCHKGPISMIPPRKSEEPGAKKKPADSKSGVR